VRVAGDERVHPGDADQGDEKLVVRVDGSPTLTGRRVGYLLSENLQVGDDRCASPSLIQRRNFGLSSTSRNSSISAGERTGCQRPSRTA
jgi:hypothetical protein